jgi:hypothetical protein
MNAVLAHAAIDCLDEIAITMERKWGIDRLPKLVDPALAVRFRAQADKLNEALASGRADAIKVQAEAMTRAWSALDKAATATGAQPLKAEIWETRLPSGAVVAIVRTAEEAHAIARDRNGAVWTLAEVALAIDAFGEKVREVKRTFPGATIAAVRPAGLNIGSAAQKSARKPVSAQASQTRGRRQKGVSGFYLPPQRGSGHADDYDWTRGDDIPF